MCEIPSNVILASEELAHLFDERNDAVKSLVRDVIERAHKKNRKAGFCGQAPSDYPDFSEFLVRAGIDSMENFRKLLRNAI